MDVVTSRLREFDSDDTRANNLRYSFRSVREGMGAAVQAVVKALQRDPDLANVSQISSTDTPIKPPHIIASLGDNEAVIETGLSTKKRSQSEKGDEKEMIEAAYSLDDGLIGLDQEATKLMKTLEELIGKQQGRLSLQNFIKSGIENWAIDDPDKAAQIEVAGQRLIKLRPEMNKRRTIIAATVRRKLAKRKRDDEDIGASVAQEAAARKLLNVNRSEAAQANLLPGHASKIVMEFGRDFDVPMSDLIQQATADGIELEKKRLAREGKAVPGIEDGKGKEKDVDEDDEDNGEESQEVVSIFDDGTETEDDQLLQALGSSVQAVRMHVMLKNYFSLLAPKRIKAFMDHCVIFDCCALCGIRLADATNHSLRHLRTYHSYEFAQMIAGDCIKEENIFHPAQRINDDDALAYANLLTEDLDNELDGEALMQMAYEDLDEEQL